MAKGPTLTLLELLIRWVTAYPIFQLGRLCKWIAAKFAVAVMVVVVGWRRYKYRLAEKRWESHGDHG